VTDIAPAAYTALFDTVYVSLYKYFGTPFGTILAGTTQYIDGLYHDRRMFGGGLPSAHFAAALALSGMDGFEARFAAALARAETLFASLNALDGIQVGRFAHASTSFLAAYIDCGRFLKALQDRSVLISAGESAFECLLLTVNTTILRRSVEDLLTAFACAVKEGTIPGVHGLTAHRNCMRA
jgi:threonine aldolase